MVRDTYPDVGAWNSVPKSALVIPLDTHVGRIGRLLGLTRRRSFDWTTAVEITDALKQLDPDDPVRYDYPLSHLGIDGKCSGKFSANTCGNCCVRELCGVEALDLAPARKSPK
jgi:endonuclease III